MKTPLAFLATVAQVAVVAQIAAAADMAGVYTGRLNEEPARASLSAEAGAIVGTLDVSGYVYRLEAKQSGTNALGRLIDQAGAVTPLALETDGTQLGFRVFADDGQLVLLEFVLTRHQSAETAGAGAGAGAGERALGEAGSAAQPALQAPAMGIDPVLVGRWVRSESYTSGDFSAVSETAVTLYGNGTYQYGPGRVIGGGDAGSFDSGGGGGQSGRWGAAGRILYTLEEGGWSPYARYYVEGNTLMLTFGNDNRVLWNRQ